jgi:hypothetical protein
MFVAGLWFGLYMSPDYKHWINQAPDHAALQQPAPVLHADYRSLQRQSLIRVCEGIAGINPMMLTPQCKQVLYRPIPLIPSSWRTVP